MVTIKQVRSAIENLIQYGGNKDAVLECLDCAIDAVKNALSGMDELTVKGRDNVDTLLGCMMAIEQIVGEDKNNG